MNKQELYESLKNRIIDQVYEPGQVLNEKALMQAFDVGRTPLREVLFDLQRDGLVNIMPRTGTFVTPLSLNNLRHLMQVRPSLEGLVAEILCDSITERQLSEIREILEDAESFLPEDENAVMPQKTVTKLRCLEAEIHLLMYAATSNPYIINISRQLQANCERYWEYAKMDKHKMIAQVRDHRKLYEAIAARDKPLSKRLAEEHSIRFMQLVLSSL